MGPRYDAASRQLAQGALGPVLTWLKVPVHGGAVPLPTEFTANRRQLDLLAQVGPDTLVHIEFETRPASDIAVRILDCRAQVMKQYPGKRLRQILVVLTMGPVISCDDPENGFYLGLQTVLRPRARSCGVPGRPRPWRPSRCWPPATAKAGPDR